MAGRNLPNWVKGYMEFTENTEPPILFREWTAISVIAACLRRKCSLDWGHYRIYPNMYVVLVAPAGKCRKGTALKSGYRFLSNPNLGIDLAADAITKEALCRVLAGASDTTVHDDGSIDIDSSMTIYSQELTVFLGYHNLELMSMLADWFDCSDSWTNQTKTAGVDRITGVWVNLIGATTPELLQSSIPDNLTEGGLASRMIFVYETRKGKLVPAPFLTEEDKKLEEVLHRDLELISTLHGEYKVTKEWMDSYTEWYIKSETFPVFSESTLAGYNSRRQVHMTKLSMILNAARGGSMILVQEDFRSAVGLLERTEINMPGTFAGAGKSRLAPILREVTAYIVEKKEVDFSALMRMFSRDVDKAELIRVVDMMVTMKLCKRERVGEDIVITYLGR